MHGQPRGPLLSWPVNAGFKLARGPLHCALKGASQGESREIGLRDDS